MSKIEPFEKYSDEYDEWFDINIDIYEAELKAIQSLFPPPGMKGMEVGIGSGKFAEPLGIKIGVEPSKKMASKTRALGIEVYPDVAEELLFSNSSFDYILMVNTICFVYDVIESFREVFRVLKDSGFIIVGFIDKESELGIQYSAKKENSKFYKYATFYSTPEVLRYLKKVGFRTTKILQILIPGKHPKTFLKGFGKGAFVVINGKKMGN